MSARGHYSVLIKLGIDYDDDLIYTGLIVDRNIVQTITGVTQFLYNTEVVEAKSPAIVATRSAHCAQARGLYGILRPDF